MTTREAWTAELTASIRRVLSQAKRWQAEAGACPPDRAERLELAAEDCRLRAALEAALLKASTGWSDDKWDAVLALQAKIDEVCKRADEDEP